MHLPQPDLPSLPGERGGGPPAPNRPAGDGPLRGPAQPPAAPPLRPELQNWQVLDAEQNPAPQSSAQQKAAQQTGAQQTGAQPSARPPGRPPLPPRAKPAAGPVAKSAVESETDANLEAIEGEAERLPPPEPPPGDRAAEADAGAPTAEDDARAAAEREAAARDRVDPILIAGLPERRIVVQPGSKATLVVSLLNNGTQPAIFDVHVEGWVHESWLPDGVLHIPVQAGERVAATITLAPPRHASAAAGEFPLYIVVRSPQHLRRVSRVCATLVLLPFTDFAVGHMQPARVELSPFHKQAVFTLPVSNLGNHPTRLQVQGQATGLPCRFEFKRGAAPWQPGPVLVTLEPDATLEIGVRATLRSTPWFASRPLLLPLRVRVGIANELRLPRTAVAEATYAAPLKPWHLVTAAALAFLLLVGTGLLAVAARVLLDTSRTAAPVAPAAAPAAPVVIVLNQAPPPPPAIPAATAEAAASQSAGGAAAANGLAGAGGAPLVQADQVTAPGQEPPRALGGARTSSATGAPLTYAEMFQEIALHYDLDWRLLAAQAYVESGFDSLALGQDGDMGLMQVLPSTWREWAPTVGATDPFDAYSNALVAATYLDYVRGLMGRRGLPQAQWMLVAYNWGPDRLGDFLDGGGAWEGLPPERARYATEILNIARTIP